jgi:flagellar protein FlaG
MIANIVSGLPISMFAQSSSGSTASATPTSGEEYSPVDNDQVPNNDIQKEATEQATKARENALDEITAKASSPSIHPSEVHFIRDSESDMVAVQIKDAVTGDELSQIPSDKMLKTMASIKESIGLLLDKEV